MESGEFAVFKVPLEQARLPVGSEADAEFGIPVLSYKECLQSRRLRIADIPGTEALSAPVSANTDGSTPVYAVMMYSSAWNEDTGNKKGIYSIPTDGLSTTPVPVMLDDIFTECGYAVGIPGKYLFAQTTKQYGVVLSLKQYAYNTADWTRLSILNGDISSRNYSASDAAYNPVTTEVYGSVLNISENVWGLYRIATEGKLEFKKIADLEFPFVAMGFDNAGVLYAVTVDGRFVNYDMITKTETTIASGLPVSNKYTSGTIDNSLGKFYYALCNDTQSALCTIDLSTGNLSKVYDFANNEEFVGMYIPYGVQTGAVPDVAQDLALTFTNNSLSGKISFVCPRNNIDGSVGEGELSYSVYAGIIKVAEGKAEYGSPVSADVVVPASGEYTFTVRLSNKVGNGTVAKALKWIGNDIPNKLGSAPKVSYSEGKATITWSAPYQSTGINGGYIDKTRFTYTVVRNNDGKIVAENTSERFAEDELEAPEDLTMYTYDVTVNYEGGHSAPVTSAVLALGAIKPPFCPDFATDPMAYFTTLDVNKDYKTWLYSSIYKRVHVATNKDKAMDDWLFTLPLNLKAGYVYNLSFDTFGGSANTVQTMEVFLGTAPMPDEMSTVTIMDRQNYSNVEKTPLNVVCDIEVPTDGLYYIGFHALSEPNNSNICLNNIKLAAGTHVDSPAPVSEFSAIPAMNGDLKADISLVAPTKTFRGTPLAKLSSIIVRSGDKIVKTFENPLLGESYFCSHMPENGGLVDYVAVAVNENGESQEMQTSAFIGHTVPVAPARATMVENTPGNVTFNWSEVAADANGKTLDPATITYAVMELDQDSYKWVARAENISGTTHTMQIRKTSEDQDFLSLAIGADNSYGRSKYRAIDQVPIGVPYGLPFIESNSGNSLSHTFLTKKLGGDGYVRWNQGNNSSVKGMVPADNDGGYLYLSGEKPGDKSALISGKISLTSAKNPIFSVAYVHFANDYNKIGINIICDGVETPLQEWETNGASASWARKNMSLDKYVGKTIQFVLYGEIQTSANVFVDCIEIIDYPQKDVAITAIKAPESIKSGTNGEVKLLVENKGAESISEYKVVFYLNGDIISEQKSEAGLPFRGQAVYTCPIGANPLSASEYSIYAEVICSDDMVASNNKSEEVAVSVIFPNLPAPENLNATLASSGNSVNLVWDDASEIDIFEGTVIEDCENLESFSISGGGGWLTIDVDKSKSQRFESIEVPHLGSDAFGFMVFDASGDKFNSTFNGHSGNKYFMSVTNEAKICDDWLISPELNGKEQTVSFFARGYHPDYPESFEILYSTSGREVEDFKTVGVHNNIGYTFQEYSVNLPEGAVYFAIRCVSKNGFMFMVDDITYSPKSYKLNVLGYNVYCNGLLVKSDVPEKAYTHVMEESGSHNYNVTAVYNYGESKASNTAAVECSSIENAFAEEINVSVVGSKIVVTGAFDTGVEIFSTSGLNLFSENSNGYSEYTVAPGIYLVRVATTTTKIVVR
ncbi:choice-of-anchor J domain-containing protein [uncultured Muribaculum sp.]|nr:choice-of-anchor J domain-containing protein [uncultured Muribaculum sp.]